MENLEYYNYTNFGDVNFFEYGCYVRSQNDDTTYDVIYCKPYDDEENLYQYAECYVDISDSWINKEEIMNFIGMEKMPTKEVDCIHFAIGCIEYYGIDNFKDYNIPTDMTKEEVLEELAKNNIYLDNVEE